MYNKLEAAYSDLTAEEANQLREILRELDDPDGKKAIYDPNMIDVFNQSTKDANQEPYVPTPKEIEVAAAEIREEWSPSEYEKRCSRGRVEWEIPGLKNVIRDEI